MSDTGQPPAGGTPDPSVPPTEPMPVTPPPDSGPALPPTEAFPPGGPIPPGGTVPPGGTIPPGPPPEGPWYQNPTARMVAIVTALALLFFLIAFLIWWGSDDGDDEIDSGPITSGTVIGSVAETTTTSSTTPESTTTTSTTTTSTTSTTTTTVPPTTTTLAPTTTEAPTTTAAPTTVAPTTTIPEIIVPPQPEATVWDIIVNSPDLGRARELFELTGLDATLADPDLVITVFVPTDEAIEIAASGQGAPDFSDPDVVRPLLEAHLHLGDAYDTLNGLSEIAVENGGPQPVTADPPTFGDTPRPANVVASEANGANGVIHVIDQVIAPQP